MVKSGASQTAVYYETIYKACLSAITPHAPLPSAHLAFANECTCKTNVYAKLMHFKICASFQQAVTISSKQSRTTTFNSTNSDTQQERTVNIYLTLFCQTLTCTYTHSYFITCLTKLCLKSTCVQEYCHPHQKQSKRCHEAFFGKFPRATVIFLINLLKAAEVYIEDASIDDAESKRKGKT